MTEASSSAAAPSSPKRGDIFETISKALGLLAGLLAVVYVVGGLQLVLRLAINGAPWQPVIAEAPRDLLLSTGASPLLVGVFVGLGYIVVNFLSKQSTPQKMAWKLNRRFLKAWAATALLLFAPFAAAWCYSSFVAIEGSTRVVLAVVALLVLAAVALLLLRARNTLVQTANRKSWNKRTLTTAVAALYGLAAVPAAMAAFAIVPPNDVKVCSTADYEERGSLVGRAGDRLIMFERGANRRLTYFPTSQTEQVFVGHLADTAACDFDEARWAIVGYANALEARNFAKKVSDTAVGIDSSSNTEETLNQMQELAGSASLRVLRTADAADAMSMSTEHEQLSRAGHSLLTLANRAEEDLRIARAAPTGKKDVPGLKLLAQQLRESSDSSAALAQKTSMLMIAEAARRQPR